MSKKEKVYAFDLKAIAFFRKWFIPFARFSIFLVFFWFGALKLLGYSPADDLAIALIDQVGLLDYFDQLYLALAFLECVIGILFLIPKLTRIVVPLLLVHMAIVCSPLLLIPDYTWQSFLIPTLEGQYIIKNGIVIAVAIGIAASATPLKVKK